ncbi:MAG: hypothetical protein V3U74_07670 [Thermodesulfobacteriota bacterium]
MNVTEKKKVCMVCGKPSEASICDSCKANIQGEALDRKQKVNKKVKIEPDALRRK